MRTLEYASPPSRGSAGSRAAALVRRAVVIAGVVGSVPYWFFLWEEINGWFAFAAVLAGVALAAVAAAAWVVGPAVVRLAFVILRWACGGGVSKKAWDAPGSRVLRRLQAATGIAGAILLAHWRFANAWTDWFCGALASLVGAWCIAPGLRGWYRIGRLMRDWRR